MDSPFDEPLTNFDVREFLNAGPEVTETIFKDFFLSQVQAELSQLPNNPQQKLYKIFRYISPSLNVAASSSIDYHEDIVIIQAATKAQAAYLFLLYETRYQDSYPFTEILDSAKDLGQITPIDVYIFCVQQVFNEDIPFSDHIKEVNSLVIIKS